MPQLLFPTFNLTETQAGTITQVYEILKAAHSEAAFDFDYQPPVLNYEAFREYYNDFWFGPVLRLENAPAGKYLCFIKVAWNQMRGTYATFNNADIQTWGVASLQRKYGHVLIRPETALDKIRELIHHCDIRFEDDKAFSNQFYVLSDAEENARKFLGPAMRQTIIELPLKDFTIEVIDDVMLVGDNKNTDPATAADIARFLCGLYPLI